MSKMFSRFYRTLMVGAALAMVSAFAVIILGVVARKAEWDIPGLDAYAGYFIAAALFLALPETLRYGDHIRVTLLLQKSSSRIQNALEYWALLSGTVITAYLAWFAGRLVVVSYITHDVSEKMDASPLWIPQTMMALGCIGFFAIFVEALLARWQGKPFFAAADGEATRSE
jgi:TRAP-type C4-dicarboxylate transport system permease small subunit